MSSQLVGNSMCTATENPSAAHFGRIKLGEIFRIEENLFEFVCLHCSHAFHNLGQFSLHVHEHLTGIVSTIAPPEGSSMENGNYVHAKSNGMENDAMEPYDILFSMETKLNDCNGGLDAVSHSNKVMERNEIADEYVDSSESFRGTHDDIKNRLAEDNLAINDDSPEAVEYSCYLYKYKFGKMNGLFKCPKCEYASEKQHDIRRHIFRHLSRPIFTCTICNTKLSSIRNHREFHQRQNARRLRYNTYERSRRCEVAVSERGINDDVRKRLAKENFEVDDSPEAQEYSQYMYDFKFSKTNGLFNCPKCDFASEHNRYVRRHIFKHLRRNIFTCKVCNMKVSSFLRHKEIHAKSAAENGNEEDSTSESNGIFIASGSNGADGQDGSSTGFHGIDDIVKQKLADDNFELDDSSEAAEYARYIFGYRFDNTNGLFKCPKCEYMSDQNHHVRRHIFGHLSRKIFKCTVCNIKMSHISRLSKHKHLHRRGTM